ncbi:hypothetical protein CcaverHIS002_0301180 [Cutaneotrichosporon cavernicola]|uniref:Uncharacterized protein n=1 Tax=Cutaneotrichosporon cavernicola TaxID=279322 RepID=A0AA48I5K0_9TREE|nr:uncharacterized protein CcaverHIS019_0301140 [Cutaneotrichosporon cavernicola]BEI82250.1 hypothetical protein CcaverHIS002_0301180 [Cutaneotrichosporon cavernicola]BEI90044.1 hypothetical protein CcaverHIS019_0301140 [Cutaneotrichosporon cavernicola]BEI97818.1 hypothetical protein CcaverHIS631_0301170 [Cutaneotrichosporon cavernicola]
MLMAESSLDDTAKELSLNGSRDRTSAPTPSYAAIRATRVFRPIKAQHGSVLATQPQHGFLLPTQPEHGSVLPAQPQHGFLLPTQPQHNFLLPTQPEHSFLPTQPYGRAMARARDELGI